MRQLISASKSFFSNEHLPPIARSIAGFVENTWFADKEKTLAILRQKRNWIAKIRIPIIQNPFIIFLYLIPIMLILAFLGWSGKMLVIHFSGGDRDSITIFTLYWIAFYSLSLICLQLILLRLQSYPKMNYAERWTLVKQQLLDSKKPKNSIKNIISIIVNKRTPKELATRDIILGIKNCKRKSSFWFYFNASLTGIIGESIITNSEFQKAFWAFLCYWSLTDMFNVNTLATCILLGLLISWPLYFCKYGVYIAWMQKLQEELKKENEN